MPPNSSARYSAGAASCSMTRTRRGFARNAVRRRGGRDRHRPDADARHRNRLGDVRRRSARAQPRASGTSRSTARSPKTERRRVPARSSASAGRRGAARLKTYLQRIDKLVWPDVIVLGGEITDEAAPLRAAAGRAATHRDRPAAQRGGRRRRGARRRGRQSLNLTFRPSPPTAPRSPGTGDPLRGSIGIAPGKACRIAIAAGMPAPGSRRDRGGAAGRGGTGRRRLVPPAEPPYPARGGKPHACSARAPPGRSAGLPEST